MKNAFLSTLGGCLLSLAAQAQWVNQPISFTTGLGTTYLDAVDANTAWCSGQPGGPTFLAPQVARTTNGGQTWTVSSPPIPAGAEQAITALSAPDASNAWITLIDNSAPGVIMHTSDGGQTWTTQSSATVYASTRSYPDLIHMFSPAEGITIGDALSPQAPLEMYRTIDGGTTWTPLLNSPTTERNEYPVQTPPTVVGNHIWFATSTGRVFHSPDKGATWTVASVDPNLTNATTVVFRDAQNGLLVAADDQSTAHQLFRTTDGGITWAAVPYSGPLHGLGLSAVPGTGLYVSAGVDVGNSDQGSSYSRDNGQTWVSIETTLEHYVTEFVSANAGWSASISLTSPVTGANRFGGTLLANRTDAALQASLTVSPNPAVGGRFALRAASSAGNRTATVRVLDGTGRLVQQRAWNSATPLDLDLSQQPAGLYVLEVQSANGTARQKVVVQ